MNNVAEQKRPSRVLPGVLIFLGIVGLLPLSVPLVDIFDGIRRAGPFWNPGTTLNLVGLSAFGLWSAVVIAALVTSLRARAEDPTFRGLYSELVRTTAVLLFVLVLSTWITIDVTGVVEQPYDDDCVRVEHKRLEVLRCRLRL
jgi:hypothetical protein